MPDTPKSAEAIALVAVQPSAVAAETAAKPSPGVDTTLTVDDTRVRLVQLFAHLKIIKIVFVDDKAELETDTGTVITILAANDAAREPLPLFSGVVLTLENDALQGQLAARLDELDAEGRVPSALYLQRRAMIPKSARHCGGSKICCAPDRGRRTASPLMRCPIRYHACVRVSGRGTPSF